MLQNRGLHGHRQGTAADLVSRSAHWSLHSVKLRTAGFPMPCQGYDVAGDEAGGGCPALKLTLLMLHV